MHIQHASHHNRRWVLLLVTLLVLAALLLPSGAAAYGEYPLVLIRLNPEWPNGANGWYTGPVTVSLDTLADQYPLQLRCVLDPTTPPAVYDDLPTTTCPFWPEGSVVIGSGSVSADGQHTVYVAVKDAGNAVSEVVSASFNIDATAPVITCPAAGPFLLNSGEHIVGPAGLDASISGLDEAATTASGWISTATVGVKTITFTAYDLAGNSASKVCSYNVIYDFGGFYPPVKSAPVLNPVAAGSTVPVKFSLAGNQGLNILAAGFPTAQQVSCDTLAPIGAAAATKPAGKSGLGYNALTGWYSYGWKTGKALAGTCQALTIQLKDGTQHLAYFKFQ